MIKVSIIIPCYNVAKFLEESLKSVINQTLKEIEIICVNDGSCDNTEEILKEFQQKDDRIKIISKENQGVASARNDGIRFAKGEFLAFLDSDDFYSSNDILETLYIKAKQNNVFIAGGEMSEFINGQIKQDFSNDYSGFLFDKEETIKYKDYQYDFGFVRFIYNREFILNNNLFFPDYERFQDPPFFVRAMNLAQKFHAINKITYTFRNDYKTIIWTPKKVNGLLNGLIDNIKIAKKYKYNKLKKITAHRFYNEYLEEIRAGLTIENFALMMQFIQLASFESFLKFFIRKLFSITNSKNKTHKIYTVLGFKIKLKRS